MKMLEIENLENVRLNSMNMLPRMRFIENGPFIPGDLLFARDQGKVVFVCGAGVSQARAKIPGFLELSKKVCELLGVSNNPDYSKYLEEKSVLPFDRMFGTLEREFNKEVIESTVCKILKPKHMDNQLAAHRILLDLAKSDDGVTKIVTTNFDRLFKTCDKNLQLFTPVCLPDVKTLRKFDGIVHLHGIANKKYDSPEADGFVLSSSSFGRAYLSEGWATKFFLDLIENFMLVFIGYRADDPPVSYLLEALERTSRRHQMYAFQEGDKETASSYWTRKGVEAIPYDNSSNDYSSLWNTLELWARRAKNKPDWIASTLALAQRPPEALKEFEKEQVLQLTSSEDGMKAFARVEPPPPAQWLCALTSADFFHINSADVIKEDEVLSSALIRYKDSYSLLPPRLHLFRGWFEKHLNSPYAMCWAIEQRGLHPRIVKHIDFKKSEPFNRHIWNFVLDQWKRKDISSDQVDMYLIESKCDKLAKELNDRGNDLSLLHEFFQLNHPVASIRPTNDWRIASQKQDCDVKKLFNITVHYPNYYGKIASLYNVHLGFIMRKIREHIDWAYPIDSIYSSNSLYGAYPFNSSKDNDLPRSEGLRYLFHCYSILFERATFNDVHTAKSEYFSWPKNDDIYLWVRMRIWAQKFTHLLSNEEIFKEIHELDDRVFWNSTNQRDLLISLKSAWPCFTAKQRHVIEKRILGGTPIFQEYREMKTLRFIKYFLDNKCSLSDVVQKSYRRLLLKHPELDENAMPDPARSVVPKITSGMVRTIKDCDCFENSSIRDVIRISRENSEREHLNFREHKPFLGLVQRKPMRAFHGLVHYTRTNEIPEKEWNDFFYEIVNETDFCTTKPFMCHIICMRMIRYEDKLIRGFINSMAAWFSGASKELSKIHPQTYHLFMEKIVSVITAFPDVAKSNLISNDDTSPSDESLNSMISHIMDSWFHDCDLENAKAQLKKEKLRCLENLLKCNGFVRHYTLLRISEELSWFFFKSKAWTRENILSIFDSHNRDEIASLLYGYVVCRNAPHPEMFSIMKASLFETIRNNRYYDRCGHYWSLLEYVWFSNITYLGTHLVSDGEFSDALRIADSGSRIALLKVIKSRFLNGERPSGEYRKLRRFFSDIWPKQKKFNTPESSANILMLMLSDEKIFSTVYESVKDYLCELETHSFFLTKIPDEISKKHPLKVFSMLQRLLPKDINRFPYGISEIIKPLGAYKQVSKMAEYQILLKMIEVQR